MSYMQAHWPSDDVIGGRTRGDLLGGKYELIEVLGVGATSVVWTARDRVLDVLVAVKLLEHPGDEREELVRLALGEARIAARLSDPAICRVIEFRTTELGDPFVVSELLHGETVEALLEREHRLPAVRAVRTFLPILGALEVAHALGIIHRDVKPSNIFLHELWADGAQPRLVQPKLLDFGIARSLLEPKAPSIGIFGTPHYMPPEQGCDGEVDERSDLWAFTASLYEAITGEAPFDGETAGAVLRAASEKDAPPLPLEHGVDHELRSIVQKGLAREPTARWASAAELERALTEWLLAHQVETDVSGRSLHTRLRAPTPSELTQASDLVAVADGRSIGANRTRLPRSRWVVVLAAVLTAALAAAFSGTDESPFFAQRLGPTPARSPLSPPVVSPPTGAARAATLGIEAAATAATAPAATATMETPRATAARMLPAR